MMFSRNDKKRNFEPRGREGREDGSIRVKKTIEIEIKHLQKFEVLSQDFASRIQNSVD